MPDLATRADVARLFGRAAFGATKADLDKWTGVPYADVVASLFPPGPPGTVGRTPQPDEAERMLSEHYTETANLAQMWWLERMRSTPYPLEERLTLFWHDHWATADLNPPDTGYCMVQNQTLRTHALGSFRELAYAITVDPAMLFFLNGITNTVGGVNENYARELLELFTLGVLPQVYTETDVRQAARALSGWTVNTGLRQATFTDARHVLGTKTILGRTVGGYPAKDPRNATEYREVIDAVLAHDGGRSASRYVAYKLVQQLGYAPDESALLNDAVIQDVAAALRAGDAWDIASAVRTLLLHPGWRYADQSAGRGLVRSPVEVLVHAAKVLGIALSVSGGTNEAQALDESAARAGQRVLLPPSVAGWPSGLTWLSQTTALARYEMLNPLFLYYRNSQRITLTPPPASGDLAGWASFMGLAGLSANTTLRLRSYLDAPGTTKEQDKQASVFLLLGASPDWQVI
jgi:uncharacterized protein (DUF1800 family)